MGSTRVASRPEGGPDALTAAFPSVDVAVLTEGVEARISSGLPNTRTPGQHPRHGPLHRFRISLSPMDRRSRSTPPPKRKAHRPRRRRGAGLQRPEGPLSRRAARRAGQESGQVHHLVEPPDERVFLRRRKV